MLPPEPYRLKAIEPLRLPTREERERALTAAGWNLFNLQSDDVYIDLLTDSGTGAMSNRQWAALMMGDESYAGAASFQRFQAAIRRFLGFEHVLPVHQGRAAEKVLGAALLKEGHVVPGNAHFDTTKAHIEHRGARALDLTIAESRDLQNDHPFKGNVDVARLDAYLAENRDLVPYVLVTVTCNTAGGQPVSLANMREVRRVCDAHGVPLFMDIARFAENAWFIREREPDQKHRSVADIARDTMDLADCVAMSAKKDALVNMGGFLATRTRDLYDQLMPLVVLYEGFPTYGGLSGRDLDAMAVGLEEGLDEAYLAHRTAQVAYVTERLQRAGVPVLTPAGGHAVYVEASQFLPHLPREDLPGQALVAALYLEHGIRTVEVGTVMAGRDPDTGENVHPDLELVRLAIPRRTYTNAHLDYVADAVVDVWKNREHLQGLAFERETPILRHFTSTFRPVATKKAAATQPA